MIVTLRLLDAEVRLSGPSNLVEGIAAAYGRFVVTRSGDDAPAAVDGRPVPPLDGVPLEALVYERFARAVQRRVAGAALLHGAALVDRRGGATIIAAPSGLGKTSLTLELAARGMRFLTDDFAALDVDAAAIHPFPRRVGIRPDGTAPLPAPFARAARDRATPRLFGKALVDVGETLGEGAMAKGPAPLARVVLLTPGDPAGPYAAADALAVTVRAEGADRVAARLAAVPGLRRDELSARGGVVTWRLETAREPLGGDAAPPPGDLAAALDDPATICIAPLLDDPPDFSRPPAARPIKRREAALALARDMFNRGPGAFAARRGGLAGMVLALAGALAGASCWVVRPGPLGATADLIESLGDSA